MTAEIKQLDPRTLFPNSYNPNHLGASSFKRLKSSLKGWGINENPIVVRPREEGGFEIVDGEHTWRAAMELNLPEVLCEIRNYDDFEARTQTILRNVHGNPDIVKMGRLLVEMQEAMGGAAERDLSQAVGMSRSTIQRRLVYGRLSKKRETELEQQTESNIPSDPDLAKLKYEDAKELWENGVIPEPDIFMPASAKRFLKHFVSYPEDTRKAVFKELKKQLG